MISLRESDPVSGRKTSHRWGAKTSHFEETRHRHVGFPEASWLPETYHPGGQTYFQVITDAPDSSRSSSRSFNCWRTRR